MEESPASLNFRRAPYDGKYVIQISLEEYVRLKSMEWISVKDRLPLDAEYTDRFLVWGRPTCGGACGDDWQFLFCRWRENGYFEFGEYDCCCLASHWMPLPSPPKE
jgi:hypothetical protein